MILMKRIKKFLSLCLLCVFALSTMMIGNVALASSGFNNDPLPIDILLSAGISLSDAEQLEGLQVVVAHMISSGQITDDQAAYIVQQLKESEPIEVDYTVESDLYEVIPFQEQASEARNASGSSRHITGQPSSYYAAIANHVNPYYPSLGFHEANANFYMTTPTLTGANNPQNDFPYFGFAYFRASTASMCEAGLMYTQNSSGVWGWLPYLFNSNSGVTPTLAKLVGLKPATTTGVYMAVLLEGSGANTKLRQVVFDIYGGYAILFDIHHNPTNPTALGGIGTSTMMAERTIGVIRTSDSVASGVNTGIIQTTNSNLGSTDSLSNPQGYGLWDTQRGNTHDVINGNKPGAVTYTIQSYYSAEKVTISY